jgi:sulfite reductase alpha subunit-like flavoprotein
MASSSTSQPSHHSLPTTSTSHPNDPIPEEPTNITKYSPSIPLNGPSPQLSTSSVASEYDSESDASTQVTDPYSEEGLTNVDQEQFSDATPKRRRASTMLVSQNSEDLRRLLGPDKVCCGGGCCMMQSSKDQEAPRIEIPVQTPRNDAYRAMVLKLGPIGLETELNGITDLPEKTVSFARLGLNATVREPPGDTSRHPPKFVTPHPPYEVYSAPLFHARELTKSGAEKRTYHFDIDVTDYPAESGNVDFVVGGAIGVCAPNPSELVDAIFDLLAVPNFIRDKPVLMKTTKGRWPTIWGDDNARELVTTRRELLTWCSDVQSYAPTKDLLRLLGEYAEDLHERKILMYLSSTQGQPSFCDLRTGPYVTLFQLLSAFRSSRPPLDHLLSVLNTLMPRFYSLSQDPQVSCLRDEKNCRRLVEIAVTVHEADDFANGTRPGVGSGFLERTAQKLIAAEKAGIDPRSLDLRIPMFRGLMANPLAREFVSDGPMLLIGAGVGVAPFRGFVHRRLRSANCANKVWVLQGVRDSLVDELYSGDWGVHEDKVKKIVQSRKGEKKYVQEEVRAQADLVWFIINALDGRIFVCGSSKGMGEGVEKSLVDVAMGKGNLNEEEARAFWEGKKEAGQYIAETW